MTDTADSAKNVQVYVRVRPPNDREREHSSRSILELNQQDSTVTIHTKPDSTTFTYDHVAGVDSTQEDVFQHVGKPISDTCLAGYNGTIFAYGQTGSGKTHTIQGGSGMDGDPAQRGVMPRVFQYLCAQIAREERKSGGRLKYSVRASFLEIYNERIYDLLEPNSQSLTLREDMKNGVFVDNLREVAVSTADEIVKVMEMGIQNRRVGETAMNRESSRSHSVFRLVLQSIEANNGRTITKNSTFHMIDLAGSERQKSTAAVGKQLKEASGINKSLSALGNVIMSLVAESRSGKSTHVHYRDSKLTFLLRDALGGNSLTYIIACVSSADDAFGETLSTLKFAQRAKLIKNRAVVNEDHSGTVDALQAEVMQLKEHIRTLTALQNANTRRLSLTGLPTSFADFIAFTPSKNLSGPGLSGTLQIAPAIRDSIVEESLSRERQWQEGNKALKEKIGLLETLIKKQEKQNLSNKMMLKLRERALSKLEARLRGETGETAQQLLFSELERHQQENTTMREQLDCNPAVVAKMIEIADLKSKLKEMEGKIEGLTYEERFGLSQQVVQLTTEKTELENAMQSPRKLLAALPTPKKRAFETFEIQRWQHEQDFEKKMKLVRDELTGAKEEVIGYKSILEEAEAEKEAALREAREAKAALSEQKTFVEAMKLRHEAEITRLIAKHQQDEEAIQAIYEQEIRALDTGMKESSEQMQSRSFELASTRAKLMSLEGELKTVREMYTSSSEQVVMQNERINGLTKQLEEEKAEFMNKMNGLQKTNSTLTAELLESKTAASRLESVINVHEQQHSESQVALESLREHLTAVQGQLAQSSQQEQATRDEVDRLEQALELSRQEVDRLTFNMEMLQEDHDSLEKNFSFQETLVAELNSKKDELDAKIVELSTNLLKASTKCEEKTEELRQAKEELMSMTNKGSHDQQEMAAAKQALRTVIDEQAGVIQELNDQLETETKTVARQDTTNQALNKELASAQSALGDLRSAFHDLQEKMSAKETNEKQLRDELLDKTDQVNKQDEEVSIMSSRLAGSEGELKAAQEELEQLKSQHASRIEELQASLSTSLKELETDRAQNRQLGEQVLEQQELLRSATEVNKRATERITVDTERINTLQQQLSQLEASSSEERERSSTEVSDLKAKVQALETETRQKHLMLGQREQELEDERRLQVLNLEERLKTLQQRFQTATAEHRVREEAFTSLSLQLEAMQTTKQTEITNLHSKVTELEQANRNLEATSSAASSKFETVTSELSSNLASAEANVDALQAQLRANQALLDSQASDSDAHTSEIAKLEDLNRGLSDQLKALEQEKQQMQEALVRCRTEEERSFSEADSLRHQLELLKEEDSRLREHNRKLEAGSAELSRTNAKLIGHTNPQQKIQYVQKIKTENDELKSKNIALEGKIVTLERAVRKLKKQTLTGNDKENAVASDDDTSKKRRVDPELPAMVQKTTSWKRLQLSPRTKSTSPVRIPLAPRVSPSPRKHTSVSVSRPKSASPLRLPLTRVPPSPTPRTLRPETPSPNANVLRHNDSHDRDWNPPTPVTDATAESS